MVAARSPAARAAVVPAASTPEADRSERTAGRLLGGHVAEDVDALLDPRVASDALAPAGDAVVGVAVGARGRRWGGFVEGLDDEVGRGGLEVGRGGLEGGALLLAVGFPGGALEREAGVVAVGAQELGEGGHLGEDGLLGDARAALLDEGG